MVKFKVAQVKKIDDKWYRLLITTAEMSWLYKDLRNMQCPIAQLAKREFFTWERKSLFFYNKFMCLGWWQYKDIILEVFGFCQRFAALFFINRKEYLCKKAKRQWHLICKYLTWPYRVPGCCRWSACSRRTLQTLPCCQSWQLSASPSLSPQSCVFCV